MCWVNVAGGGGRNEESKWPQYIVYVREIFKEYIFKRWEMKSNWKESLGIKVAEYLKAARSPTWGDPQENMAELRSLSL